MRYISLKNEQNRCNALRGALLLPVGFFRAVFCQNRVFDLYMGHGPVRDQCGHQERPRRPPKGSPEPY